MNASGLAEFKSRLSLVSGGRARSSDEELDCTRPDAMFFRGQTLAIVRHFFEIASQIGRLPSILGREFFRARVSHRGIPSFEDQAVFVHDVERALGRLQEDDAEVLALVGLFQYSLDDVASMLGRSRTRVSQRYTDSIDRLAELLLEAGLLRESRPDRHVRRFTVQDPAPQHEALPPKKPVGSVTADMYHVVGSASGAGRMGGGSCDA
jgi:hypothetical protein